MKKLVSLTLALVMIVTCLAGISFAADPIAKVETNGKTVEVETAADLAAAIDPSGKSVVTLLKDANIGEATIDIAYSCTIDLAGHRLSNTKSNLLNIKGIGSENNVTTVKNGTVDGKTSAITWRKGGLVVDNCTLLGQGSAAIQILNHANADSDAANYKDVNIIKNSTLCCPIWVALSFNSKDLDFSAVTLTIENSNLVSPKEAGTQVLGKQSSTISGAYVLGKGVNMYTYKAGEKDYMVAGVNVTGEPITMAAALGTATVDGKSYAGFTVYSTPEYVAPVVPETPAAPAQPETPATPSVPSTTTPDVTTPATGVSVVALGVMAMVSLAGAVITKKH